jgi:hypothetical protein
VKTGDTDDDNDEQVYDSGSEFRCGDKRMLGSVVKMTKTEWCRVDNDCDNHSISAIINEDITFTLEHRVKLSTTLF